MTRKKFIFVIVEGSSDEDALGAVLDKSFDKSKVVIHVERQDITTKTGNTPSNIVKKVCKAIQMHAKNNHLTKIHYEKIIHLTDMDGAYMDDVLVVEDLELKDHKYSETQISTPNRQGIIARNKQKRENLDKLASISSMWGIPYQIYYMSSNLDHVLYNKLNSTNRQKEDDAYLFAKKHKDDVQGFQTYICKSAFSVIGDYKTSWEHIKKDNNSLKRFSNLGLIFSEL